MCVTYHVCVHMHAHVQCVHLHAVYVHVCMCVCSGCVGEGKLGGEYNICTTWSEHKNIHFYRENHSKNSILTYQVL